MDFLTGCSVFRVFSFEFERAIRGPPFFGVDQPRQVWVGREGGRGGEGKGSPLFLCCRVAGVFTGVRSRMLKRG
jgi:hypothetical protein